MERKESQDVQHPDDEGEVMIKKPMNVPLSLKIKTVALYILLTVTGLLAATPGPTLINLKQLFQADTATISLGLSLNGVGYMIASALVAVLRERYNTELQISIALLAAGTCVIIAPWTQHVYALITLMMMYGFGHGYCDCGGNAYMIELWQKYRIKDALLQGLHLAWSVGSTLAPFVLTPFLTPIPPNPCDNNDIVQLEEVTNRQNISHGNISSLVNCTVIDYNDVSKVRYSFLLVGTSMVLTALLFLTLYLYIGRKKKAIHKEISKADRKASTHKMLYYAIYAQLFMFSFCMGLGCIVGGNYFSLFVVEHLNWTLKEGAVVTSLFWAFIGIGRLLGVPVSWYMSANRLLYINVAMIFLGYLLMFLVEYWDMLMYMSVSIAGLGYATLAGNILLWMASTVNATTTTTSIFSCGLSAGFVIGYIIIGNLMQAYGNVMLSYSLVAFSFKQILLVGSMKICISKLTGKQSPAVAESENIIDT